MKKFYFLLTATMLLASCGGGTSFSSISSEATVFNPTETFSKFKETGTAYSGSDNLGMYTDDLNFFVSGITIDDDEKESSFELNGTNIKVTEKMNNVNDSTAANLKGSLVFEEGALSMTMPDVQDASFAVSRLRPAIYLNDYTAYVDISENGMIRIAINSLVNSIQPSWAPTWSFPSKGKGYREIKPHSLLDERMPMGGNSSSVNAWADVLQENYESYESCYTFTLTKDKNSIVFASTDKVLLEKICLDVYDRSVSSSQEDKEKYEKKIKNFFAAATIKTFELGFEYNDSVWTGRNIRIDADLDKEIQKTNDPDASYYLDSVKAETHLDLLSGENAKITFPSDMGKKGESSEYKYEQIPLPIVNPFN